jgi:hypothetical protein
LEVRWRTDLVSVERKLKAIVRIVGWLDQILVHADEVLENKEGPKKKGIFEPLVQAKGEQRQLHSPVDNRLEVHPCKVGYASSAHLDRGPQPAHSRQKLLLPDSLGPRVNKSVLFKKKEASRQHTLPRIVSITVPTSPAGMMTELALMSLST